MIFGLMDGLDGSSGQFRNFQKDDFEVDWIKVAECRFGQVYQVKFKLWREKCALKVFDTTLCANNFYRITRDEASKTAKIKFKYIASIYGLCTKPHALVMEFMTNGSLNNLLATHTLMWPKKFQMIHETSLGMNFLHSLKPPLLHLNLKTSNILLDDHLHVKISDFGLIHWEEGMNKKLFIEHLTLRGNISYIPPESFTQCADPPGTTFDVYRYGIHALLPFQIFISLLYYSMNDDFKSFSRTCSKRSLTAGCVHQREIRSKVLVSALTHSFAVVVWEILTQRKPYAGCSVTSVLIQVSHGKRPCVNLIADTKPHECDQMIRIMEQCWDQDNRKRPHFSDTVRQTEALSEILKIPDAVQSHKNSDEGQKQNYPWLISHVHKIALPEMPDLPSGNHHGKDGILSLLSKKEFVNFRQSVKQEDLSAVFSDKTSLLHHTVASGDMASVEHVLHLGAKVNCTTARGYSPLIIAVLYRFHNVVSLLLEHGADATHGDEDQWTALHFAAQNGDDRSVRLLLDKAAVADAKEKAGWMPLHLACQNGHEAVVRLLLSRLSNEAAGGKEHDQGKTPLHLASTYGHVSIVKLLLSQRADPNVTDSSLTTALHIAAEEGHNQIVRHLVTSGAHTDSVDSRGCTPLHLAALKGHTGICRQLLSNGASTQCRTLQGWTPMHLAALRGHESTVVQLANQGVCVDARGENGWTPLHLACYQSEPDVVAKLLLAKANPNVSEDSGGWTPLHLACASVSFQSVLHLLLHHADVNAVNSGKATPLHLVAQHGCVPIAKALLLNGADRTLLDSSAATALSVAQRCEKWDLVQLLQKGC